MRNGTPIKGKTGWVAFGDGMLPEFEYKKYLKEEEVKAQKIKEEKWQNDKIKREKVAKTQKRKKSRQLEKIYKAKELVKKQAAEIREISGQPPKKEDIKDIVDLTAKVDINILKGNLLSETAHNVGLSQKGLEKFLVDYYKVKNFGKYSKMIISKHKPVRMPSGSVKQRNTRTWIHLPRDMCSFKDRIKANIDPIVSTENKTPYERLFPAPQINTPWSKEIIIVKDRTLQPIKRTRIAVHSFQTAGTWNNEQRLRKVSCTLAKSAEDKYLTVEGGIIVSRNFAHREHLEIGDKLLSINGLKGVICEIRKHSISDLVINKNVVWDETKMSRLCGGAVLDLLNNDFKIFYQPEHLIRNFKKNKKVRFSPDFVPFLAYYLTPDELSKLQGTNKQRFQDILYMLNLRFVDKDGYLYLIPKTTQVNERKGGKLYDFNKGCGWGKCEWEEGLSEPIIKEGTRGYYPFILKKIWIPDWFFNKHKLHGNENDNENEEGRINNIIEKLTNPEVFINFGIESICILYENLFAHIANSISYLVGVPKNGKSDEVYLNKNLCVDNGIKEGDSVFVLRYPVVQKENIQKMKVVFTEIPDKTIGINVESMTLMNGDFDGDPLYVLKIPQTDNFGNAFKINKKIYQERRTKIENGIKTIDMEAKLGSLNERKIKIKQIELFLKAKEEEGKDKRKLAKFHRTIDKIGTSHIRTDGELIEEAKRISDTLDASGVKAAKIGTLTKWMWFTTGRDKDRDKNAIECVASLEIIKDRVGLKSEIEYKKSIETLKACKRTIEHKNKITGRYEASMQTKMFKSFISKNTYKDANINRFPKLANLRNKPLIHSNTPYAVFILLLCKKDLVEKE
jgi:hypothetical protein